jgi:hypothetical protein
VVKDENGLHHVGDSVGAAAELGVGGVVAALPSFEAAASKRYSDVSSGPRQLCPDRPTISPPPGITESSARSPTRGWRVLRKRRCSTDRITDVVKAIVVPHHAST